MKGLPKTERLAKARDYLDRVHLSRYADLYPAELSGGMKQRVALARLLALDSEVLLMDEPFGALDSQTRELLQEELQAIWRRDRKTALFVTHDIDEAIYLGTRVLVFTARPGRIKADIKMPDVDRSGDFRKSDEYLRHARDKSGICCATRCSKRARWRKREEFPASVQHWIVPVALLAAWEVCGALALLPRYLPPPSQILAALYEVARRWRTAAGGCRSAFIASPSALCSEPGPARLVGLAAGLVPAIRHFFDPLVSFLYAVPKIAFLPIFLLLFGLGQRIEDRDHRVLLLLSGVHCFAPCRAVGRQASGVGGAQHGRAALDDVLSRLHPGGGAATVFRRAHRARQCLCRSLRRRIDRIARRARRPDQRRRGRRAVRPDVRRHRHLRSTRLCSPTAS